MRDVLGAFLALLLDFKWVLMAIALSALLFIRCYHA